MHSSETMPEVEDGSAKLVLCACTHLGGYETWPAYVDLVTRVMSTAKPKVRQDGYVVAFQTDAFVNGRIMPRGPLLLNALLGDGLGLELLDYKVWQRLAANFRQPPCTHVFVLRPGGGSAKRPPNENPYFQGVWQYGQKARGKLNSWPDALCQLMVEAFTEPGDVVLDPFAGSARILGVASALGRAGIGYEIDEELAPVIEENLS